MTAGRKDPPAGGSAEVADLCDTAEQALTGMAPLVLLTVWIEHARRIIDAAASFEQRDEVFRDRLDYAGIRPRNALWDEDLSEGLATLGYLLRDRARTAHTAVDAAMTANHHAGRHS